MTKDPKTDELMMVMQFAKDGNIRNILSKNFNNILWGKKIKILYYLIKDLSDLHKLGYFHKDLHSGNILKEDNESLVVKNVHISDFGLSGSEEKEEFGYKGKEIKAMPCKKCTPEYFRYISIIMLSNP